MVLINFSNYSCLWSVAALLLRGPRVLCRMRSSRLYLFTAFSVTLSGMETLGLTVTQNYRKLIIPRTRHKVISAIFINISFNMIFSWPRRRGVITFWKIEWLWTCTGSSTSDRRLIPPLCFFSSTLTARSSAPSASHRRDNEWRAKVDCKSQETTSLAFSNGKPHFIRRGLLSQDQQERPAIQITMSDRPPSPPLSIKFSRDCLGQISKNWSRSR